MAIRDNSYETVRYGRVRGGGDLVCRVRSAPGGADQDGGLNED